jgi:hypothetical protein
MFASLCHVVALEHVTERAIRRSTYTTFEPPVLRGLLPLWSCQASSVQTVRFATPDQRLAPAARAEGYPVETSR